MNSTKIDNLLKDENILGLFENKYCFVEDLNEIIVYNLISDLVYWGIDVETACKFSLNHFPFEDRDQVETWELGVELFKYAVKQYPHFFRKNPYQYITLKEALK